MRNLVFIVMLLAANVANAAVVGTNAAYLTGAMPVSDYPHTQLCYALVPASSNTRIPSRFNTDASNYIRIGIATTTNAVSGTSAISGSATSANTGVNMATGTWYPVAYVCNSATDRTIHIFDGIGGTRTSVQTTVSRAHTGTSWDIAVGAGGGGNNVQVQDAAVTDIALNNTQLTEWAAGKTALACSFASDVVAYQPLVAAINESGSIGTVSNVGSPTWTTGPTLTGPSSSSFVPVRNYYQRAFDQ